MLVGVSLLWGASFMFIKVAVRELSPATLITGRLGLAALTLAISEAVSAVPRTWWRCDLWSVGVVGSAVLVELVGAGDVPTSDALAIGAASTRPPEMRAAPARAAMP